MIGAIILAAGSSRRFGGDKRKATLPDGTMVIVQSVRNALAVFDEVLVVLRCDDQGFAAELSDLLDDDRVRTFCAPESEMGMGHSLANAAGEIGDWDGVFVFLADMPFIRAETLRLLKVEAEGNVDAIVVPVFEGMDGHPVCFGRKYFSALGGLSGDRGAKAVLMANQESVIKVEVEDSGVVRDVDRPEDLDSRED